MRLGKDTIRSDRNQSADEQSSARLERGLGQTEDPLDVDPSPTRVRGNDILHHTKQNKSLFRLPNDVSSDGYPHRYR